MSTLFLEAFGRMSGTASIDAQEEDLYSVFLGRSELMGWGAPASNGRPLLWAMEEAELNPGVDPGLISIQFPSTTGIEDPGLTADADPYRIGFVQVGLNVGPVEAVESPSEPRQGYSYSALPYHRRSADPVLVLPALVQCFYDSLSRFGDVEVTAFQVSASYLESSTENRFGYLAAALNWFNTNSKAGAEAIVAFDQDLLGCHDVSELVSNLRHRNTGAFKFRSVVGVPRRCLIKVPVETPQMGRIYARSELGVSVAMPEWTPSAAGWVLASVVDAARAIEPDIRDFAIRVTRV